MTKVGFGGSCHWCMEAVFQAVKGVLKVEQGWIASEGIAATFSEGVLVYFDARIIDLAALIEIHLHTHSCTVNHPMRQKYRSAIYIFSAEQQGLAGEILERLQSDFEQKIVTSILPFCAFKENQETYLNYYTTNPAKPFCQRYIEPKLRKLSAQYSDKLIDQS